MHFDLPLAELEAFKPEVAEPDDFDEFWARQLSEVSFYPISATFAPAEHLLETVEIFDVTFSGFCNNEIRGWLMLPKHRSGPLPTIVEYIGYGGGRGLPHESLLWSAGGYAHFVMDTRGQGSQWSMGSSADPVDSGDPSAPGYLTKGVQSPETYYYVRLMVDATRAVEAAKTHDAVDNDNIIVYGRSQGGGLALAAANLSNGVKAMMSDVPFLSNFERAIRVTDEIPYSELADYFRIHTDKVESVFRTLSYVDVVNHAKRTSIPGLFSVGLADAITPPSTVFSAYNWYSGPKSISVYPYDGHDGGGAQHELRKLSFAAELMK